MPPYRVVVIDDGPSRTATTLVMQLDRSPDVGATLELPHGASVVVEHVISAPRDGLAGVVLATPA